MELSIVILNFRKKDFTLACMASLYEVYKERFMSGEFECIIVDNLSGDDSVFRIKEAIKKNNYKNFLFVLNDTNAGFGGGNNLGTTKARGKYILFLNNDTVVRRGLAEMLDYLKRHTDIAILGGPLKNFDGSQQSSTGRFYTPFRTFLLLLGLHKAGLLDNNPQQIKKVDWVKGALFLIRRQVFDKLGGFDVNIFMYIEDMEMCYRAHLAGYRVYFYPDIDVLHKDQGSSNRAFAIVNIYKNLLYFYAKHRSGVEYTMVKTLLVSKAMAAICVGIIFFNKRLTQTYFDALRNMYE